MFKDYLLEKQLKTLCQILANQETDKHYALIINFAELHVADPILGTSLLTDPEETLKKCDLIVDEVQMQLCTDNKLGAYGKSNIHTRVYDLTPCPELHRTLFPRNEDLGLFLQVSGTVIRVTAVKMLEHTRVYVCTKCKFKQCIEGDYDLKYIMQAPSKCRNPESCPGTNFHGVSNLGAQYCKDYQEIKMQEHISLLDVGTMPNTIWVTLEDDLVDVCKPGDSITVCGTIKRRWNTFIPGKKIEVECTIKANHVQVNNDTKSNINITSEIIDEFDHFWEKFEDCSLYGRDLILRSFCPQIYGMYLVKLAIAVVLAGGSSFEKDFSTGARTRTEPHLLLVGDPGTGKSQLLKFAAKVIARSVLTTGIGSTSAGLTVAALMENGEWHLEGGALVLADGGVCCIDEFNSMRAHDKTSIHEAMEQQTISVAKAGIVCKLNTRCSILAAINPLSHESGKTSSTVETGLASPLLSRFDLVLDLKDSFNPDFDSDVIDYILRGYKHKSKFIENKHNSWPLEKLQAYFNVIKKRNPKLTEAAQKMLSAYYQLKRQSEARNKARTTVRLLDSLVRLSQAHARLVFHENVEVMDAVFAISLVEISLGGDSSTLQLEFNAFATFPQNPMETYYELRDCILCKLNLLDLRNNTTPNSKSKSTNIQRNVTTTEMDESKTMDECVKVLEYITNKSEENKEVLNNMEEESRKVQSPDGNIDISKDYKLSTTTNQNKRIYNSDDGNKAILETVAQKDAENVKAVKEISSNVFENPEFSQNTKIKQISKRFKFESTNKRKLVGKSISSNKSDSGNFSQTSFSSIFEDDVNFENIDFDI